MSSHHLVGRSPEPSPCGYAVSSLAIDFASFRRATRSEAQKRLGVGKPHPARGFVLLARCPSQERFRTRERQDGAPSIERVVHNEACQEGAVEIALHFAGTVAQDVHTLTERLPRVGAGRVVELAQPGAGGAELDDLAAACLRLLPELGDEHAGTAHLGRAAKAPLEGPVGELLSLDRAPLGEDAVRELAVGPLALRGKAAFAQRSWPPFLPTPEDAGFPAAKW